VKQIIQRLANTLGYNIIRRDGCAPDMTSSERAIHAQVKPYTMTSVERVVCLIQAVEYISTNNISGDIAECGVWRGGSMMAVAHKLLELGDTSRTLFLYDTFQGMPPPTKKDKMSGVLAAEILEKNNAVKCIADLDDVRRNLLSTNYPPERLRFIAGKVEETLPVAKPESLALLRLDTDWYESTLCELQHLYPVLTKGGILIIDDYGHWEGARAAVDEFFGAHRPFLHRIDYSGRLLIKG